jgi:hypothetical protein
MLSPAASVHGEARRRWVWLLSGWIVLLLWGLFSITGGNSRIQQFDSHQDDTTHFLHRDCSSGQPAVVERAWTELALQTKVSPVAPDDSACVPRANLRADV